jgi:hypothetical protein
MQKGDIVTFLGKHDIVKKGDIGMIIGKNTVPLYNPKARPFDVDFNGTLLTPLRAEIRHRGLDGLPLLPWHRKETKKMNRKAQLLALIRAKCEQADFV